MEENTGEQSGQTIEQRRYTNLFERLKEGILKKNLKDDDEKNETADEEEPSYKKTPLGRGVISITEESPLGAVWREWKEQNSEGRAQQEEKAETELPELVLEPAGTKRLPLDDEEIEKEKQHAAIHLMMKATQYQKLVRSGEDGQGADIDAYIVVYVAQKRMAAWVCVFPPHGEGKPLRRAQLYMELQEHSVSSGIDQKAMDYLIEEQPYFTLVPIASGTPMIHGENGSIIEKFKRKVDKTFAVNERGDVDYRVQNYIQTIHTGDVICESVPPTMGKDGMDVLGAVIPAKNGEPAKLLAGQNTGLNEDKTQIIAMMDGHLQYESGKFQVKPLFYVSGDVDYTVGNIDFLGDVHISGDVREDFIVHATGTVTVDGLVEGAVIEAGKDIFIAKGILGDEKAVIKAGGNVQTEYIENCIIYAGDTVRAGSIISSCINSDNQIIARVGRGTVIGGRLIAAHLIDARIIGCRTERPTSLIVGELPYIQEQKEEIAESLQKIAKEKEEIDRNISFLDRGIAETEPDKMKNAANLRLRKSVLSMQEKHLQNQLKEFDERGTDIPDCRIKADTVYPVTKIRIKDYSYTVNEKTMDCKIHISKDEIELM